MKEFSKLVSLLSLLNSAHPKGPMWRWSGKGETPERDHRYGEHHRQPNGRRADGKLGNFPDCHSGRVGTELTDGLSGPQPDRHAERYPGRLCTWYPEYALSVRRPPEIWHHPLTKGVFDIDSIQLVNMVKRMRDDKIVSERQRDRWGASAFHRRCCKSVCRTS